MDGNELLRFTAQLLDIYDADNADIIADRKVSQQDILEALDRRYREDAFPAVKKKNANRFTKKIYLDNWEKTFTADASSTGTTLVGPSGTFDPEMVGALVYNSTDSSSARIKTYTSSTTVTLDETIGNTWDGDTVYLITGRYSFKYNNSLRDVTEIRYVGIKYDTDDTDYIPAEPMDFENAYQERFEDTFRFSTGDPVYMDTSNWYDDEFPYPGFTIRPIPEINITAGVFVRAAFFPEKLSSTTSPLFPKGHHLFLAYGAAADLGPLMEKSSEKIQMWESKYSEGLVKLKMYYQPIKKRRRRFYRDERLRVLWTRRT